MNLYSPDIINKELYFHAVTYSINRHSHEETLSVSYTNNNTQKNDTACFMKKAAIHTCIMEILDYDIPEKEASLVAFKNLKSTLPLLSIDYSFNNDNFAKYCSEHTAKDIESFAEQIMPILQICFQVHPALSYLYPLYHAVTMQ